MWAAAAHAACEALRSPLPSDGGRPCMAPIRGGRRGRSGAGGPRPKDEAPTPWPESPFPLREGGRLFPARGASGC